MHAEITKHFRKRFRKRVARTSRIQEFVDCAFYQGKTARDIKDSILATAFLDKEAASGSSVRIYHGFAYWFCENRAVTVYSISHRILRRI